MTSSFAVRAPEVPSEPLSYRTAMAFVCFAPMVSARATTNRGLSVAHVNVVSASKTFLNDADAVSYTHLRAHET